MTRRPVALCLALAAVASATAQTQTGTVVKKAALPYADTDWSDSLLVERFDNPLVHLDRVEVRFRGAVHSTMRFENRNANRRSYSASMAYSLVIGTPSGDPLLSVRPAATAVNGSLAAFDGVVDYAGASGVTLPDARAEAADATTLTADADVQSFVGSGTVALPVRAFAETTIQAAGNFDKVVTNESAADVEVVYHYSYTPASVGDRVWLDADANGLRDDGENGVSGVLVHLLDKDGNAVLKEGDPVVATTDANGAYKFDGLMPGTYAVRFDAPAGTGFTTTGTGGEFDSDAGVGGKTAGFTLRSGEARTDLDAGLVGLQSVGDRVWLDADGDGVQDAGEPGLSGIGVSLLDGGGNVVGTQATNGDGLYSFTGLLPGAYSIRFDPIGGYARSAPGAGGDRALDSDADADGKASFTLNAGEARTDLDAGYRGALMLGDRVFFDANANGLQDPTEKGIAGVAVSLLDKNLNPVLDKSGVAIATTTDSQGAYLFSDLLPGDYKIRFALPAGYSFTGRGLGNDRALDSDADAGGLTDVIALSADNLSVDAGLYGTLSLGDRVWKDLDKDGLQDGCEPGVPGVKLHLLDAKGVEIDARTTDANGAYKFSNLAPDEYTVVFDAPTGYGFTKPFADGRYKAYDSNVDPETGKATVDLASNDATIDAGLVGALKIGDTVWLDCDGDGKFDADQGEKGLPGVKLFLLGDLNGDGRADVAASTTTDKDGRYRFLGLSPGAYQVTANPFDLPKNVVQTTKYGTILPYVGLGRLTSAGDNLDFDFGYKPSAPSSGCSHKWWSANLPKWSWDCLWVGKKCHTKAMVCAWMKRDDCGDKSISLYQRLCSAKLNVGNGCNEGKLYTSGKTCISLKEAIRRADDWMAKYPVGCNVSDRSSAWSGVCDVFAILDAHCNGR